MSTPHPHPRATVLPLQGGHPSSAGDDVEAAAAARARQSLPDRDPAVFDCYLGRLVHRIAPHTEADPLAILVSLIATAGVHLGPGPHVQIGDDRHPLLIWPLIIGRTAAGRKGASWSSARRLLTAADSEFSTTNVRSGLTSGEGLSALFATDTPTTKPGPATLPPGDGRLLVFEPEWAAVMARMKREGNALSATLRATWEGGDLSTMTVTARIAKATHIGIVAHISPTEFRTKVSTADMAGGTYNRFLPIAVARSQFLPLAPGIPTTLLNELGFDLATRLLHGTAIGALGFTPDAVRTWRRLYVEFGTDHGDDGPLAEFTSRSAPYCLRIAALHATLDGHTTITTPHLIAAAALIRYATNTAHSLFTTPDHTTTLAAWITAAGPQGRTREQIRSEFFRRNKSAQEVTAVLDELVTTGTVVRTTRPRADGAPAGRQPEVYIATERGARGYAVRP